MAPFDLPGVERLGDGFDRVVVFQGVEMIVVPGGPDAADDWIATHRSPA